VNRYILRRLAVIPVGLLLVNFAGFAYAYLVRPVQLANNPMFAISRKPTPLLPAYLEYLKGLSRLDFGVLPPANADIGPVVLDAAAASFGLLTLALLISVLLGSALGIKAVRNEPTRIAPWLTAITTAGLAMPGFYVGSLLIMGILLYLIYGPTRLPLPVQGFGWDLHLLLPTVVLAARPTSQLAQVTASLLAAEMDQQHIVTARSVGVPLRTVRRKHALRNIIAPVSIAVFAALRLMVSELIVIEYIFSWPGLGRLLALILLAPRRGGFPDPMFLNPAALATTLTLLAAVFLLADLASGIVARMVDPRLRAATHRAEEDAYQNA
jgi:peptide/nickel transport system permease protein